MAGEPMRSTARIRTTGALGSLPLGALRVRRRRAVRARG